MPPRKRHFIIPRRAIELAVAAVDTAAALSNPVSLLNLAGHKALTGALNASDRARWEAERSDAITELKAQMRYLDGHLVKTVRFFERNADLPATGTIAAVPAEEAREFRGLRRDLLGSVGDLENAVFGMIPYLHDDEREVMTRHLSDVRGILHYVLCEDQDTLASQTEKMLSAHRIIASDIDGLRP